jgi:hypothetical protein
VEVLKNVRVVFLLGHLENDSQQANTANILTVSLGNLSCSVPDP